MTTGVLHVVVPAGVADPSRASGGNTYDRMVCDGLAALGWGVRVRRLPGGWPRPDPAACRALAGVVASAPDGELVLVDGLIGSAAAEVLVPQARRLRLVVLVHLPLGWSPSGSAGVGVAEQEARVLEAAGAVVATSDWARGWLLAAYGLAESVVHVARPGVRAAPPAAGSEGGGELLCVAAVTPGKGHDVLLAALATLDGLPWRCVCVGPLDRDPDFVADVAAEARALRRRGEDRVLLVGPQDGGALDASYAAADLLVLASRHETYGMVVTEALARGLPVIATDVGGLPEALGGSNGPGRPGLLVPPGDAVALAAALRRWLGDPDLRDRLRRAASERRGTLAGWPDTAAAVARVLSGVAP